MHIFWNIQVFGQKSSFHFLPRVGGGGRSQLFSDCQSERLGLAVRRERTKPVRLSPICSSGLSLRTLQPSSHFSGIHLDWARRKVWCIIRNTTVPDSIPWDYVVARGKASWLSRFHRWTRNKDGCITHHPSD